MADITISMSDIVKVKTVLIDPLGEFKVRRLGAGESLDLSSKQRRLNAILVELDNIDLEGLMNIKEPTEEQKKQLTDMQMKVNDLMEEVNEIRRFEQLIYEACFDDGGSGKTKELFKKLPLEARQRLFEQIFDNKKVKDEEKQHA